jgi:hypothetical protein
MGKVAELMYIALIGRSLITRSPIPSGPNFQSLNDRNRMTDGLDYYGLEFETLLMSMSITSNLVFENLYFSIAGTTGKCTEAIIRQNGICQNVLLRRCKSTVSGDVSTSSVIIFHKREAP